MVTEAISLHLTLWQFDVSVIRTSFDRELFRHLMGNQSSQHSFKVSTNLPRSTMFKIRWNEKYKSIFFSFPIQMFKVVLRYFL